MMDGDSPDSNRKTHLPMMKILADNVSGIIIVNRWGTFKNVLKRSSGFCTLDDIDHIFQCNLGIGNDQIKKNGMGMKALRTQEALYIQRGPVRVTKRSFDGAVIMTITDQTSGTSTGTCKILYRQCIDHFIIKILRNRIEFGDENRYHSLVAHAGISLMCWVKGRIGLAKEGSCLFSMLSNL